MFQNWALSSSRECALQFLANVALMSIQFGGLTNIRIRYDDCIHQTSATFSVTEAVVGLAAPRQKNDETGVGLK